MALTVKDAGERIGSILADRRPLLALQVDIGDELGLVFLARAGVDLFGEPLELIRRADLVPAVNGLRRQIRAADLALARAVVFAGLGLGLDRLAAVLADRGDGMRAVVVGRDLLLGVQVLAFVRLPLEDREAAVDVLRVACKVIQSNDGLLEDLGVLDAGHTRERHIGIAAILCSRKRAEVVDIREGDIGVAVLIEACNCRRAVAARHSARVVAACNGAVCADLRKRAEQAGSVGLCTADRAGVVGSLQRQLALHFADQARRIGAEAVRRIGDRAGVIRFGECKRLAGGTDQTAGNAESVLHRNRARVVALRDRAAVDAADQAAGLHRICRDLAKVRAAGHREHSRRADVHRTDHTADSVLAVSRRGHVRLVDYIGQSQVRVIAQTDNAAHRGRPVAGIEAVDNAFHGEILDLDSTLHDAEQARAKEAGRLRNIRVLDQEVLDREALTVKLAGERLLCAFADARPLLAAEVDVVHQLGVDGSIALVDMLCKPCQLCAGIDLIPFAVQLRLGIGLAVPCAIGDLLGLLHGNGELGQAPGIELYLNCVEVRRQAAVRHGIHEVACRKRDAPHLTVDPAVGQRVGRNTLVIEGELILRRKRDCKRNVIHHAILQRFLCSRRKVLRAVSIDVLERLRVEDAGHLLHTAVNAVQLYLNLVAREERGLSRILRVHIGRALQLGDMDQLIADLVLELCIAHTDHERAALTSTERIKVAQIQRVRACRPAAVDHLAHDVAVLVHRVEEISYSRGGRERQVHLVVGIGVIPGVIVVIPCAVFVSSAINGHGAVSAGAFRTADDHNAEAVGADSRIGAAVGGIIRVVHVDRVIGDGEQRVGLAGREVRPVVMTVASADLRDSCSAVRRTSRGVEPCEIYLRPVEVRLDLDVGGIGVDDLPQTECAHTLHLAVRHTHKAGRAAVDIEVSLVAVCESGAERHGFRVEIDRQRRILGVSAQPACLRGLALLRQTPGIVAVVSGQIENSRLGCAVFRPCSGRLDHIVVVIGLLEEDLERCVLRSRDRQLDRRGDRHRRFLRRRTGGIRLVDLLRHCVDRLVAGDRIDVVQAAVTVGIEIGRIVGLAVLLIGCAHERLAAHFRAIDLDGEVIRRKARAVVLLAAYIEADAAQIDLRTAADAAGDVALGRQVQRHAADHSLAVFQRELIAPGSQLCLVNHVTVLCSAVFPLNARCSSIAGIVQLVNIQSAITFAVVALADIERVLLNRSLAGRERQRPEVLGEGLAVVAGCVETINIRSVCILTDVHHGVVRRNDLRLGAEACAVVGGALVPVGQILLGLAARGLEDLAILKLVQKIRLTCHDHVGLILHTRLQRRDRGNLGRAGEGNCAGNQRYGNDVLFRIAEVAGVILEKAQTYTVSSVCRTVIHGKADLQDLAVAMNVAKRIVNIDSGACRDNSVGSQLTDCRSGKRQRRVANIHFECRSAEAGVICNRYR